jgi:hypothetical protein
MQHHGMKTAAGRRPTSVTVTSWHADGPEANPSPSQRLAVQDGEPKTRRVDRRLAYLLSCSIRFELVQRGELTLDQAIQDVERLRVVAGIACSCEREILDAWRRSS